MCIRYLYQAIDLYSELKKKEGTLTYEEDQSKEFNNVYNSNDKNIFRRRSMYGLDRLSDIPEEKPQFYPDINEFNTEETSIPTTPRPFPLNPASINRLSPSVPSAPSAPPMPSYKELITCSSPISPNNRKSPCEVSI